MKNKLKFFLLSTLFIISLLSVNLSFAEDLSWENYSTWNSTQNIKIEDLYKHLDLQKNNALNFLNQEEQKLLEKKEEALKTLWDSSLYDTLKCLWITWISDIKRDIPTDSIKKAITDDYINLNAKIHKFEVMQKLQEKINPEDLETLNIQIANFWQNYQETILKLSQNLENQFQQNLEKLKQFADQNMKILKKINNNKLIIENVINKYNELQKKLNSSRLLYWLTFQQISKTKDLIKNYFKKLIEKKLNKEKEKILYEYPTFINLNYEIDKEINLLSMQFSIDFDLWFNKLIWKFINNNSLEVLQTSIQSIKDMYYSWKKINCKAVANLTNNEKQLLNYISQEISERWSWIITTWTIDQKTKNKRKKEYLSKLQKFFIDENKLLSQKFKNDIQNTIQRYKRFINIEEGQLAQLNELNQKYRNTRNQNLKKQIRQQILSLVQNWLCDWMLHKTDKQRCEKIKNVMIEEYYKYDAPNNNTSNNNPDSNSINSNNYSNSNNNQITNNNSNQQVTNTANTNMQENIKNAVNKYVSDLENKYPNNEDRKAVMQVVIKNLKEKIQWETNNEMKQMYQALQTRLENEIKKL